MRARAVIGANFGDEGKGLVTDYLCAKEGAGVVVRFNGGAQAGHTVVLQTGERHVFSHFGSGTMYGTPTFLSRFFVCNPLLFADEADRLPVRAIVYADPDCLVTTFADMLVNQRIESERGENRHGSCGVGFNQTICRHEHIPLTMRDLWDRPKAVGGIVRQICAAYLPGSEPEEAIEDFVAACRRIATVVRPASIANFRDPVFEGAQGLLLDQRHRAYFPYLTRSNTGIRNVLRLCEDGGWDHVHAYYVSRSYLTRHGAGPLPDEDPSMVFADDTNIEHPFQGRLRFAPLAYDSLRARIANDYSGRSSLVMTHCDQLDPPGGADLYSFGEHRDAIDRLQTAAVC